MDMCLLAAKHPPRPDQVSCEAIAAWLSFKTTHAKEAQIEGLGLSGVGIPSVHLDIWSLTIAKVRSLINSFPISYPELDLPPLKRLEVALRGMETVFCIPRPVSTSIKQMAPWAEEGFEIIYVSVGLWSECRGRDVGATRNSVVAHFAELAMYRIGWRDPRGGIVGREALAAHYARWMKKAEKAEQAQEHEQAHPN